MLAGGLGPPGCQWREGGVPCPPEMPCLSSVVPACPSVVCGVAAGEEGRTVPMGEGGLGGPWGADRGFACVAATVTQEAEGRGKGRGTALAPLSVLVGTRRLMQAALSILWQPFLRWPWARTPDRSDRLLPVLLLHLVEPVGRRRQAAGRTGKWGCKGSPSRRRGARPTGAPALRTTPTKHHALRSPDLCACGGPPRGAHSWPLRPGRPSGRGAVGGGLILWGPFPPPALLCHLESRLVG